MNCCTQLDDIWQEHVPWQPYEPYWISRSKSFFPKWTKVHQIVSPNVEKIVVHNAVIPLSISWSVPEIFAIKVLSCPKSSTLLITQALSLGNFARICTSATPGILLNFKVKVTFFFVLFFFLCAWCYGYPWSVLSLEQGLVILLLQIFC